MNAIAASDLYPFETNAQQSRFTTLTTHLRCLVCQNQTIAESSAPIAADLRHYIYEKIRAGESDQTILDYLASRYGAFILYRPPLQTNTIALWLAPFILLFVALCGLIYFVRRHPMKGSV